MAGIEKPVRYKNLLDITVDFNKSTVKSVRGILAEYGVCVIENVLDANKCDDIASKAVESLEKLGRGADRENPAKFGNENTVPQTRTGMYQMCYSNNSEVNWVVRTDPNVKRCFEAAYATGSEDHAETRLASVDAITNAPSDLMVSGDGMTVLPNRPYKEVPDWAHLDQMHPKLFHKEEFANYQGQVGMTNCDHAFRVSVGSHKVHGDIIDLMKKNNSYPQKEADRLAKKKSPAGFLKLPVQLVNEIRDMVESNDPKAQYQCLIPAKKGSLILWDARCIHSAYRNPEPRKVNLSVVNSSPLDGWRCIIYVSFRRKAFMTVEHKKLRANAFFLNETTGHWGMSKLTCPQRSKLPDHVQRLFSNPVEMYEDIYKPPELSEEIKYITCISDMLDSEPQMYKEACKLFNERKYSEIKDVLKPQRKNLKRKASSAQSRMTNALKKMRKS